MVQFQTFLQAGFECSTHKNRHGERIDVVRATRHDEFATPDYRRLQEMGIKTVREGARWHVIETSAGRYDFSSLEPIYDAAQETGAEIILDLLHFGWPDRLDVFRGEFVTAFAEFAYATVEFLKKRRLPRILITPVNEISYLAWAAGSEGLIYPRMHGLGGLLKRQLVRAAIAASRVVRERTTGAVLCSAEPAIQVFARPEVTGDQAAAERHKAAMFEAWDMLTGRSCPELGGSPALVDVFGLNYYDRNQWIHNGVVVQYTDAGYRPFREILADVHERYRKPVWVAETGSEGEVRAPWFEYVCSEARAALAAGVPVEGVCLYPIVNHPGWDDGRHCLNGLWDYPDESGFRESCLALALAVEREQARLLVRRQQACR